jgi:putative ABC transport system permease protein
MSTLVRKSVTDLTRRKARTFFTILTLAIAVASVGMFGVSPLMQQAMDREVAANRSADVTVSLRPLELSAAQLEALGRVPNIAAVEPRSILTTRVWVGERREQAIVVGVRDYARQTVDVVRIDSGAAPRAAAVLTDQNNARAKSFDAATGEAVRLLAADGSTRTLQVSGVGRNLTDGEDDPANDWITFYATPETVADLSGSSGYTSLAFRLDDAGRAAADRTVAAVREHLRATTAFTGFNDMPLIQERGSYPGKEGVDNIASLFSVLTLLALLTALLLVSNTMTTLVGEQTGEIASMKAIGARRRDIRRLYLRTALLLGALGALVGAVLGVLLANALVGSFASQFFGVDAAFGVSVPVVVASAALGLVGPPLAALPAIRRATGLPLAEALRASGSAAGGQGRLDAALRRVTALPRSAQIGLRGVGRRKRRTGATVLQVSLAVATLLALLSVGAGVAQVTRGWWDQTRFDTWVQAVDNRPLGRDAGRLIDATPGVRASQEWLRNEIRVGGRDAEVWALPAEPMMNTDVTSGRWYTDGEVRDRATVAVLGEGIAETADKEVGDQIRLSTGGGPISLRVVGISGNQAQNGDVVFMPVTTLQTALGTPGAVNQIWVATSSTEHGVIDRTTTRLEDTLAAHGHQVGTVVNYDAKEKQVAANRSITTSITILGLLIVAISMVGLVNSTTMSIIERTREIGVLRSVGARARDVRRIFASEGLVLAVAGWLLGVPLGYLLARALVWASSEAVGLDIAFVLPLEYIAIALAGTVILALVVMLAPLHRAARLKPGDALRYA